MPPPHRLTSSFCVFARGGSNTTGKRRSRWTFSPWRSDLLRRSTSDAVFPRGFQTAISTGYKVRRRRRGEDVLLPSLFSPLPLVSFFLPLRPSLRTWLIYKGNKCPHATPAPSVRPSLPLSALLPPTPHCKHPRRRRRRIPPPPPLPPHSHPHPRLQVVKANAGSSPRKNGKEEEAN